MISLDRISKGFAGRLLFEDVSLLISERDRIGIVGENGAGKTTLMHVLTRRDTTDTGVVSWARDLRIGHLSQDIMVRPESTVLETAVRAEGELAEIERQLALLPDSIAQAATEDEHHRLAERLASAHARYEQLGGHEREVKARRVLAGLGFHPGDEDRRLASFSGGYGMRAELARLLVENPDVLLLDEPTNHLDLESVLWFQSFLASYAGALVIISHDRAFLNGTTTSILELANRQATRYPGNFDDYVRERDLRQEQLLGAARNQERKIRETERFIERFRYKATKARQVQSRIKALDKIERIELASDSAKVRFRFPQPERTAEVTIELRAVAKAYGEKVVHQGLDFQLKRGEKVVLVGPNGAGKSTLLKLLAGAIEPDEGERQLGTRVHAGYYTQHRQEMLDLTRTVLDNALSVARDPSLTLVRTQLGAFLFRGDDVGKPTRVLSGGEKSRLALAMMLLDPPSVLLMDEPTIHLDMPSVDALISALKDYEGALCFVSHDVHFIRQVAQRVVRVEPGGVVTDYAGDWDYYVWKRRQAEESLAAGAVADRDGAAGGRPGTGDDRGDAAAVLARTAAGLREERRREAETRNQRARRTKGLRQEIAGLETEIEALEAEKAGIEGDLADPATYAGEGADIAALRRRHHEVEAELAALLERWEQAGAALEAADSGES